MISSRSPRYKGSRRASTATEAEAPIVDAPRYPLFASRGQLGFRSHGDRASSVLTIALAFGARQARTGNVGPSGRRNAPRPGRMRRGQRKLRCLLADHLRSLQASLHRIHIFAVTCVCKRLSRGNVAFIYRASMSSGGSSRLFPLVDVTATADRDLGS